MRKLHVLLFAAAALTGFAGTASADPAPKMPFATMAELPIVEKHVYDEDANADKVVDDALARAKKNNKLLLIDLGGNWCPDCIILHNLMEVPEMKKFIDAHYEVALVDVGRFDKNAQIGARYGYNTRLKGVPTVLVVDPKTNKVINGERVFALSTARSQTPQALADYLANWTNPNPQ
ncbi:MAG: thioredoxin family protein [Alphaproteobacteria bacterium]|jgi:thiol-disulfide isomerase/thioredoxin|nr:thioredoxin family protein [Alphaproteobacteria bacterium]